MFCEQIYYVEWKWKWNYTYESFIKLIKTDKTDQTLIKPIVITVERLLKTIRIQRT